MGIGTHLMLNSPSKGAQRDDDVVVVVVGGGGGGLNRSSSRKDRNMPTRFFRPKTSAGPGLYGFQVALGAVCLALFQALEAQDPTTSSPFAT